MKTLQVYIDTSVFGGWFDDEFSEVTKQFFEGVFNGMIIPLLSDTLVRELIEAPIYVQELFEQTRRQGSERVALTEEVLELQEAYLKAGVVTPKYANDALRVAHATLARADVIVSWNFKHLVNPMRVRAFNGVNLTMGYGLVVIMTPVEVFKILEEGDEQEENS